jgi:hypothetical protein
MPVTHLLRRGARYHLQMRLSTDIAAALGLTHLRLSLRTSGSFVARRRMREHLGWASEFAKAPDLLLAGMRLAAHLRLELESGQACDWDELDRRKGLEQVCRQFIERSRDREFGWVGELPDLPDLWKAFVDLNLADEKRLRRQSWTMASGARQRSIAEHIGILDEPAIRVERAGFPTRPFDRPTVLRQEEAGRAPPDDASDARGGLCDSAPTPMTSAARPMAGSAHLREPRPSLSSTLCLSEAAAQFVEAKVKGVKKRTEAERERARSNRRARYTPILAFISAFLDDKQTSQLTAADVEAVGQALSDIPTNKGFPSTKRDLFNKYQTAKTEGWKDFERVRA